LKNFEFNDIKGLLAGEGQVIITSHHNPDGDAIGSCLALYHYLAPRVKKLQVIVPNDFPAFLKWLPGNDHLMIYSYKKNTADRLIQGADLIFCLDYNSLHRSGDMAESLRKSPALRFLIDHHPEPVLSEFDFHYSDTQPSSTSELIYSFIKGLTPDERLDLPVAENLFVGIMTDTGSFSYACNLPDTFRITAKLIDAGVNAERAHRLVYDTYSEERLRLLGYSLSEKMTVIPEFKTAYIALSLDELERFHHQMGDTEGVVNYALSIEGVVIAVLLTERKDRIRLSFRSKGNFAVNQIARAHFQGGGHMNAAGGDSFETLPVTIDRLKQVLVQFKEEIDRSSY
jgi:phosphoesterase RecJ-like protein